jgi:hypothetical protein
MMQGLHGDAGKFSELVDLISFAQFLPSIEMLLPDLRSESSAILFIFLQVCGGMDWSRRIDGLVIVAEPTRIQRRHDQRLNFSHTYLNFCPSIAEERIIAAVSAGEQKG